MLLHTSNDPIRAFVWQVYPGTPDLCGIYPGFIGRSDKSSLLPDKSRINPAFRPLSDIEQGQGIGSRAFLIRAKVSTHTQGFAAVGRGFLAGSNHCVITP